MYETSSSDKVEVGELDGILGWLAGQGLYGSSSFTMHYRTFKIRVN